MTLPPSGERFRLTAVTAGDRRAAFARDVRAGLTASPRSLPCHHFYDTHGSRLFEAICELPEYYLTRAEREILDARAAAIVAGLPAPAALVELGSGSAAKTRLLIEALLRRQDALLYVPLDISQAALEDAARGLLRDYPALRVRAVAAEYQEGLRHLDAGGARSRLILWLGSNVGNLDRAGAAAFLGRVRETMAGGDRFLLGADLRKARAALEAAYDDARGVTAEFNLNLLARVNRELGGHFDLSAFRHRATYDENLGRVEMYLVSARAQRVRIDALGLEVDFAAGEAIHTENSYKYSFAEIDALASAAGLAVERRWTDRAGQFSVNLLAPV